MYGKTISYAIQGIDAQQITVEADIKGGLSKFSIVGLPSNSVKESKDRHCIDLPESHNDTDLRPRIAEILTRNRSIIAHSASNLPGSHSVYQCSRSQPKATWQA